MGFKFIYAVAIYLLATSFSFMEGCAGVKKIIIWDNDGTISGSVHPDDRSTAAKRILPNVAEVMAQCARLNIICSGCRTPQSELRDFDPDIVITKFIALMDMLPVSLAAFSPARGGTQCYVLIKDEAGAVEVIHAHQQERYQHLIGEFKKPGNGMLVVLKDIVHERFGCELTAEHAVMIGDTWHDEQAATSMGIPFVDATRVHNLPYDFFENGRVQDLLGD